MTKCEVAHTHNVETIDCLHRPSNICLLTGDNNLQGFVGLAVRMQRNPLVFLVVNENNSLGFVDLRGYWALKKKQCGRQCQERKLEKNIYVRICSAH